MSDKSKMFRIRPAFESEYRIVDAASLADTMCRYKDVMTWVVTRMPDMTRAEIDALPEFRGW